MLFIFRQLRRLELRKRSGRYFIYAFGEIVLIVVGILIALQISEWNQSLTNERLEQAFLQRIEKDLKADLIEFGKERQRIRDGMAALEEAVQLIHRENVGTDLYKFNVLFDMAGINPLKPQTATYRELESTGQLNLIQDDKLRAALQDHYAEYEGIEKDFESIADWMNNVSSQFEAESAIMKYTNETKSLFPSKVLSDQDWAFFNDPSHPHFVKMEATVASKGYRAQNAIHVYDSIIPKIETLIDKITEALNEL